MRVLYLCHFFETSSFPSIYGDNSLIFRYCSLDDLHTFRRNPFDDAFEFGRNGKSHTEQDKVNSEVVSVG